MQDVEVEVLVDKMFAGDKTDEIAFRGKRRYLNKLERLSMDFRDIMIVMGLLSDDAVNGGLFGKTFCLKCTGISNKVGTDVTNVKVGDEVMAIAPSCLGGYAYAYGVHCVKKPTNINWHETAILPVPAFGDDKENDKTFNRD